MTGGAAQVLSRIGLVVHPSRAIDRPFAILQRWALGHQAELVQVQASCQQQHVAPAGAAADCDLIVSIGGDGTTLAAIHVGADVNRPVLGVTFGSLGALTAVSPGEIDKALERFSAGDWIEQPVPALELARDDDHPLLAINDIAVVREGQGQLRISAEVDGTRYARFAGDGCIVSTPIGSSGYALAAGGPLLAHDADAFLITPLTVHGGSVRPMVIAATSELSLEVDTGHGGARLELDGQVIGTELAQLTVGLRPSAATVVTFSGQEPFLAGLRRRRIIIDSPRILADDPFE